MDSSNQPTTPINQNEPSQSGGMPGQKRGIPGLGVTTPNAFFVGFLIAIILPQVLAIVLAILGLAGIPLLRLAIVGLSIVLVSFVAGRMAKISPKLHALLVALSSAGAAWTMAGISKVGLQGLIVIIISYSVMGLLGGWLAERFAPHKQYK